MLPPCPCMRDAESDVVIDFVRLSGFGSKPLSRFDWEVGG